MIRALIRRLLGEEAVYPWRWATVSLMGRKTLHGRVREDVHGVRHVEALQTDGTFAASEHGPTAIYSVLYDNEAAVRLAAIKAGGNGYWPGETCVAFKSSAILPKLCSACTGTAELHAKNAAERERVRLAKIEVAMAAGDNDGAEESSEEPKDDIPW